MKVLQYCSPSIREDAQYKFIVTVDSNLFTLVREGRVVNRTLFRLSPYVHIYTTP